MNPTRDKALKIKKEREREKGEQKKPNTKA